jgi:hypothetical protein
MTFQAINGEVYWLAPTPVRLGVYEVETLLALFDRERAVRPYLDLHEAHVKAGGVERVSSNRREA